MNGLDFRNFRPVPGPVDKGAARNAVHVLVLTRPDPDDPEYAEWDVEHPDCCPWVCFWTPSHPDAFGSMFDLGFKRALYDRGHRDCQVDWEILNVGLDSLTDVDGQDGFEKTLPEGRYLIEAWFTPGGWAGDYYDAEGGLTLLGPEPTP